MAKRKHISQHLPSVIWCVTDVPTSGSPITRRYFYQQKNAYKLAGELLNAKLHHEGLTVKSRLHVPDYFHAAFERFLAQRDPSSKAHVFVRQLEVQDWNL